MADKDINIDIHTKASGDGAKKTAGDISKLREGSAAAADTSQKLRESIADVDNISEDARATLLGLANDLDKLGNKAASTANISEKLAKGLDLTDDESKQLARSLENLDDKAKDAGRGLSQAEVASKQLVKQQRAATVSTNAATTPMGKAEKSSRNLGLAALEASRGIEDMQYGIRGVLNNIPQMILMLGGSAGLTAAISVLAVGITVLAPLLNTVTDAMKANAEAADIAAKKKIAAARAARAEAEELERQSKVFTQTLANENQAVADSIKIIDDQTAARRRAFTVNQQIQNELLGRDIALVSGDSTLSDLEKVQAIIQLKRDAQIATEEAARAELAAAVEDEQKKVEKAGTAYAQLAELRISKQRELSQEIKNSENNLDDLAEAVRQGEKGLAKTIPALDKALTELTTFSNVTNPLRLLNPSSDVGSPDRKEFETDEAFLQQTRQFFDQDKSSNLTRTQVPVLETAEEQLKQLETARELLETEKERIAELKKQKSTAESELANAKKSRDEIIAQGEKQINILKQQAEQEKALSEARASRTAAEANNTASGAAESTITREVSELRGDLESDLESTGAAASEIAAAKVAAEAIAKTTSDALRDGVIDTAEFAKITSQLAEFRRMFGVQNQATLTNIQQLMTAVQALIKIGNAQGEQIKVLQSQIISR